MRGALLLILFVICVVSVTATDIIPDIIPDVLPDISTIIPDVSTISGPSAEFKSSHLWIIIVGFILAFTLAFGVGANDVANVFGTSVGAKVLTLKQACLIATVAEIAGSVLLGYKVSDTVRKGILDISMYNGKETELMLGLLSALAGSSIWNLVATFFKLPISGTHSIVGATVGFSVCAKGLAGVNWLTFAKIVASWFVSPVLSGIISACFYMIVRHFVLKKEKPLEPGLRILPIFYGFTLLVNIFSIVHDGPKMLYLDNIPWWGSLIISIGVGFFSALAVQCFVVPRTRKTIQKHMNEGHLDKDVKFTFGSADNSRCATPPQELAVIEKGVITPTTYTFNSTTESNGYIQAKTNGLSPNGNLNAEPSSESIGEFGMTKNASELPLVPDSNVKMMSMNNELKPSRDEDEDTDSFVVRKLFSFLQIMTATFGSFAHGGNDVSNAIGPLIGLWAIYTEGTVAQKSETPIYILLFGGFGIAVGLWVWGRRVIQTIGEDLTKVTPSSGFTIEIGAAFTVLLASKIGLPISTTHCKVGSVVFVGWTKSTKEGVDWKLFRNIVIAWVVTVPLTAAISAFLMYISSIIFL